MATPSEPPISNLDSITPDWGVLEWEKYIYIPTGHARRDPEPCAGLPIHLQLLLAMEILAELPHSRPEEGR